MTAPSLFLLIISKGLIIRDGIFDPFFISRKGNSCLQ